MNNSRDDVTNRIASQQRCARLNALPIVGYTRDGFRVFNRPNSHHHYEGDFAANVLARVTGGGRQFFEECVDFGTPIGDSQCVATALHDSIRYAIRRGRVGHTRFVLNRVPEPCSSAVVILKWAPELNGYLLVTGFVGRLGAREPWDPRANAESVRYWLNHALIWGSAETIPGTETDICPWTFEN